LALEKARAIQARHPNAVVIGSDTTVVLAGEVLNKPTDLADAERMLRALSDNDHQVYTGVAVVNDVKQLQHVEATSVFLSEIPDSELRHYLSTGDSLDKAGAYGIQGYAARWITRIEGDFFNVMGLPIAATVRLIGQL
jgi:septum formation protein